MKHCIIVKWTPEVVDKKALLAPIQELFDHTLEIDGVHGVSLIENSVNRSNRYDLMIQLEMEESSLSLYDKSRWHQEWKARYGKLIESKAIFDFE